MKKSDIYLTHNAGKWVVSEQFIRTLKKKNFQILLSVSLTIKTVVTTFVHARLLWIIIVFLFDGRDSFVT